LIEQHAFFNNYNNLNPLINLSEDDLLEKFLHNNLLILICEDKILYFIKLSKNQNTLFYIELKKDLSDESILVLFSTRYKN
jgi:hypothetical protein